MKIKVMERRAEAIIEKIDAGYADIMTLCQNMPVSAMVEASMSNGWSVKDMLAHIAAWDWRYVSLLEASHNTDAPLQAKPDIDALNEETFQERENWTWEQVEADFSAAHQAVLAAICHLPAQRLDNDFIQQNIAEETWEHYAEHLPDLQQWYKQVAGN